MKKWLGRVLFGIFGTASVVVLLLALVARIVNRTNGTIVSGGEKRKYLLHVPPGYDPSVPTPLVISMHGFAEWPAHQQDTSRWNALADAQGFLVVYPMGTRFPLRWRATGAPGNLSASQKDVTFLSDLIDNLSSTYNIDPRRVYANGLSNGGGMSFVLSCALADRIAAVGMVAGAYLYPWEVCNPGRPVPAIVFHGTADPIVPFAGGGSGRFPEPFPAIPEWVAALAARNGCAGEPALLMEQDDARAVRYSGCGEGAEVIFYTIEGGGHTWPGGVAMPEFITGKTSYTVDATRLMWDFFQQHPLPE